MKRRSDVKMQSTESTEYWEQAPKTIYNAYTHRYELTPEEE